MSHTCGNCKWFIGPHAGVSFGTCLCPLPDWATDHLYGVNDMRFPCNGLECPAFDNKAKRQEVDIDLKGGA